jgi:hypothetical protein
LREFFKRWQNLNTHADKTSEHKSRSAAGSLPKIKSTGESTFQFIDNRPEAIAQRALQEMANNSPKALQMRALQNSPQAKQAAQLKAMSKANTATPIQQKKESGITQFAQAPEGKELTQGKFESLQLQENESDSGRMAQRKAETMSTASVGVPAGISQCFRAPRARVLQLKAITGLNKGQEGTEKNVVWIGNGKQETDRFWLVDAGEEASRALLLKKIATIGGELGNQIDLIVDNNWLFDPVKLGQNSQYYDPLMVRISGIYNGTSLAVDYHFGSGFSGYVIRVDDDGTVETMVDQPKGNLNEGEFSNVHDVDNQQGPLVETDSSDAVTKIAGEGARWEAVRNASAFIRDNSHFYTNENTGNKLTPNVRHVSFPDLWKSWKETFGKAYNIPDTKVASKLKEENIKVTTSKGVEDVAVKSNLSTSMRYNQDICVDGVKPGNQEDLNTKRVSFYKFTLLNKIKGNMDYDEQVDAVTENIKSLEGVTIRDIGGCTGLTTFEYLLEVAGGVPNLEGAVCEQIGDAITYPKYRDDSVPKLAPNSYKPRLDEGARAYLGLKRARYNGILTEALRQLEEEQPDRWNEVNIKELIGENPLIWDGEPDTDLPSVVALKGEITNMFKTEIERLDKEKEAIEEEGSDEDEAPKKGGKDKSTKGGKDKSKKGAKKKGGKGKK